MQFESYIRKPFEVEAIEVTEENIKDLAKMIGKLKTTEEGTPFIEVNKDKVPNVGRVWVGYWVTKVGNRNIRCYTKRIFESQFVKNESEIDAWVQFINGKPSRVMPAPPESTEEPALAENT